MSCQEQRIANAKPLRWGSEENVMTEITVE